MSTADIQQLTDAELAELAAAIQAEQDRRYRDRGGPPIGSNFGKGEVTQ